MTSAKSTLGCKGYYGCPNDILDAVFFSQPCAISSAYAEPAAVLRKLWVCLGQQLSPNSIGQSDERAKGGGEKRQMLFLHFEHIGVAHTHSEIHTCIVFLIQNVNYLARHRLYIYICLLYIYYI